MASILGLAIPREEPSQAEVDTSPAAQRARTVGRSMLKRRVEAAKRGEAAPRWGPPTQEERASQATLMGYGQRIRG